MWLYSLILSPVPETNTPWSSGEYQLSFRVGITYLGLIHCLFQKAREIFSLTLRLNRGVSLSAQKSI